MTNAAAALSGLAGVGLFRYELIQEVIDPQLSTRQRGRMVRELSEATHVGTGFGLGIHQAYPAA